MAGVRPPKIKGFSERLYILDGQAGFIWRYFPNGDELTIQADDQAVTFYDTIDLAQIIDFDINASDGTVILLYSNGHLDRYADGRSYLARRHPVGWGAQCTIITPTSGQNYRPW